MKRGFFRDLSTTFGSNTLILISGALGSALAARILGPEKRGELAAALAWVSLLGALADVGISQSAAYLAATSPLDIGRITGTCNVLALAVGLVFSVLGQFTIVPILSEKGPSLAGATAIYLFSIPFSAAVTYNAAILQGAGRLAAFNLVRTVLALAYVVGIGGAAMLGIRSVPVMMSLIVALQAASMIWSVVRVSELAPLRLWRPDLSTAAQLFRFGAKSYLGNLSWFANGRLDQVLLTLLVPIYSLGIYAVAVSYSAVLFSLSVAIAMVAFPRVAAGDSLFSGLRTTWGMVGLSTLTGVVLGGCMMAAAPFALPAVFGSAFRAAIGPAVILLVATVFLGCNYVLSNCLRALGYPFPPVLGEMTGLILTVAGLLWTLPRWGLYGAAWVSLASYAVTTAILVWLTRRFQASGRVTNS